MVPANGNTPIISLSDAAELRCARKNFSRVGGSQLRGAAESPCAKPEFGTGQVADYGRLRWASIQLEK
jgi:hypothetical protein